MQLKDKKMTVIGMGKTGIATANFLAAQGGRVTLIDHQPREAFAQALSLLDSTVQTRFGTSVSLPESDWVIPSPGVDFHSPLLDEARHKNAKVISEIELASLFNNDPVIAVTGTNGKTTVTTLIGNILEQAKKKILVGGNIGTPFISLVGKTRNDFIVIEASSFQLEGIETFRPNIAVILNITPDHLDRHKTMEQYIAMKAKIASNQTENDVLILNYDDPHVSRIGEEVRSKKLYFSTTKELDEGAFVAKGEIIIRLNNNEQKICGVSELRPVMQWQVENILAASLTAAIAGISAGRIAETVKEFSGLEHRLEWVRTLDGIDFVNDSKSTNIGAVQKSLNSFDRPIILIAGGKDKGSEFASLKPLLKKKLKHLVLIGETKSKFTRILNGSFSYEEAETLPAALQKALSKAASGDVVLLSPACASFDMFKNYEDRGNQFKAIVNGL